MKKVLKVFLALVLSATVIFSAVYTASAASAPGKVTEVESFNNDDDEINLRWKKVKNADGYQIKIFSGGEWKGLASTKKNILEVENLAGAKNYKFKVRAYVIKNSKRVYGPYSSTLTASTEPDEVERLKASSVSKTSVKLSWSAVKRATKYQVYIYDSAKGKYVRKTTVASTSVTIKGLEEGKTYKFKVRAYFKGAGGNTFGEFSDVLKVKTKSTVTVPTEIISGSKAVEIALKHAGLSKSEVLDLSWELEGKKGSQYYEVEFEKGRYEYSYAIDAEDGKILRWEKEKD